MHVFAPAVPPQKSPSVPSQAAIVVPPQGEDVCSTEVMQVPGVEVAVSLPTQLEPSPHGSASSQAAPIAPSGSHAVVVPTQTWSWPQDEVAQESPGAGGVAHVPQMAYLVPEQYPLVHCALKAHDAPFGPGPVGAQAAGGLPLKKSVQA